jgi:hypothetical protein
MNLQTNFIKEEHPSGIIIIFFYSWWGETEYLGTAATTGPLYEPRMIGDVDCEEIGGMKIGRGNEGLREILPQRHLSSTNPT